MMKFKVITSLVLIIISLSSVAQGAAPEVETILDHEDTGGRGKLRARQTSNDTDSQQTSMEKISEKFPEVKKVYQECIDQENTETGIPIVPEDCMWEKLNTSLREQIINYLDEEKQAIEEDPSIKTGSQGNFRTTKDKTTRKLEEYLKERLSKILYDENKEGSKVLSDYTQFYEIYKSQIGQNIIRVASDICIFAKPEPEAKTNESDPDVYSGRIPNDKAKREENKEINLANLSVNIDGEPKSYKVFNACLTSMAKQCKDGGYAKTCNVLKYMEEAKRGIKDLEGISKEIHSLKSNNKFSDISTRETTDKKELAKATLISSGDIDKAELDEVSKTEAEILEQCLEESSKKPSEECLQYLTEQDDKETIEAEFMIRQKAIEMRVKQKIEEINDEPSKKREVITEILKEEGLNEDQIQKYLEKESTVAGFDPATDIKLRYEKQREAIIKELTERKFDKTGRDPDLVDPNKNSFTELKNTAETKSEDLKESIHFFNVVGAFIEIKDDKGNNFKNTNALKHELENSGFSSQSENARFNSDHNRELQDILSNTKGHADEADLPTLSTENIDQIIYEINTEKDSTP